MEGNEGLVVGVWCFVRDVFCRVWGDGDMVWIEVR